MRKEHKYQTTIEWTGNSGCGTETYKSYERSYELQIEGKETIFCSSDPSFLGDKTKLNPEEMLLASISSCHMLWYLHLCANEKIVVTSYTDKASGIMEEYEHGGGKFIQAVLQPNITIIDATKIELAKSLHHKANEMCFIANSLNFKVDHQASILITKP